MGILNVFELILLSSLIGSLILIIILIIKSIFRDKLNSTFHYYIWLILLIKLIIPVGPQSPLNISNIYTNSYVQSITNTNTQINPSKQLETTDLDGETSISPSNSVRSLPLISKVNIEKVFCFIWIFGTLLLIGELGIGYKKLKSIVDSSIKDINSGHKEILYTCMKVMNIRTQVELSYSEKISSPSLCGILKPKILIPVIVAANVSDEEFKYIIMHELTHFKSRDIFINLIVTLLTRVYWFNPILIYGFHKMRQDCEISCDGQAISYLEDGKNLQYGNAIIRVLELGGKGNRLMGTTSMVMNSSEIKRRIVMISKYKKVNIKNILLGAIIVVIIGGLGIALNTSKSKTQEKRPVALAEEFVRNIYTVDAKKVAEFKKFYTTNVYSEEYMKIYQSLDKNIEPLMTKEGYEAITANTFNSVTTRICDAGNYTAQVTDFSLDKNVYGENEDKVRYHYEVKLKFISSDGKIEKADVSKGAVELLKENGQWKVWIFTIIEFPKLYK
ncbi:MAG: M56 family metallopeptidase [Clostridiaceae bacterium]|nr:M56 family metallopeptidase [Clostridiaceae bacterium]